MSLILEALKKLDRERQAPERGVVIVGAAGTREAAPRGVRALVVLGALGLSAAFAALALWPQRARETPPPAPAPREAAAAPHPPSPAASPPPPAVAPPLAHAAPPGPHGTEASAAAATPRATPLPETRLAAAPRPTAARSPERTFVLTAISWSDGRPVAVLNDRLVREGDSFDGVTILRIGETEVEIEVDGRRLAVAF